MPDPTSIPTRETPGAAEYRALLDHCTSCRRCRTTTAVACPDATILRRAWSATRRATREGRS